MEAHQSMACHKRLRLLDSQVPGRFPRGVQGFIQRAIHQPSNHQGTGRRGLQAAQGEL